MVQLVGYGARVWKGVRENDRGDVSVAGGVDTRFLEYLPVLLYFLRLGSRGFSGTGGGGGVKAYLEG